MVNNPSLLGRSSLAQNGGAGGVLRGLSVGLLLGPVPVHRKNGIFSRKLHRGDFPHGRVWAKFHLFTEK